MNYRRYCVETLPPEEQLPLLINAMQPGDVLRISPTYRSRQIMRAAYQSSGMPRPTGIPTPKFKHKIWDDPQTMETCIERLS